MMNLAICSLSSGSSGNSYLVLTENTALLIDAGISTKQIELRLKSLGLSFDNIRGILVTHEHQDHVKGLRVLTKKCGAAVWATEGTIEGIEGCECADFNIIRPGEDLLIGDISVHCFQVSHDAAQPVGYRFNSGGRQISIVTDTGIVTEEVYSNMRKADILVLESNHDENILRIGRYPWFLKQRILSDHGHLSNDAAAEALARLLKEKAETDPERDMTVLLAHLSKENNFPQLALTTVTNVLEEQGISTGKKVKIETLSRTDISPLYII